MGWDIKVLELTEFCAQDGDRSGFTYMGRAAKGILHQNEKKHWITIHVLQLSTNVQYIHHTCTMCVLLHLAVNLSDSGRTWPRCVLLLLTNQGRVKEYNRDCAFSTPLRWYFVKHILQIRFNSSIISYILRMTLCPFALCLLSTFLHFTSSVGWWNTDTPKCRGIFVRCFWERPIQIWLGCYVLYQDSIPGQKTFLI